MSLHDESFVLKLAAKMATGPADTDIGGAIASGNVSLNDAAAVLYPMGADGPGGSNKVQYAKVFDLNTDPSETATNYGVYLANALPAIASAALFSFEGDPEDEGLSLRVIAFTSGGDPISEVVDLDSDGEAVCSTPMKGPVRIFADGVLTADLVILHDGTPVGLIPAGGHCATSEIDIGLESTLDGSGTIATPTTAPAGVSFSRPATASSRLLVGGDGELPPGSAQGIWLRWTVVPEMLASPPVHAYLLGYTPD